MDTPEPTLLSLPKGFLRQLLDVLLKDGAPESVTALFQTCKTLKQLVLDNTCLLLDVDVSSPYAAEEGAFELAAACKKAGGVHLMLAGAEDAPWADECAQMVLCGGTAEYGGPLNPLRKVTLEAHHLYAAIPPYLPSLCPRLTHLTLTDCIYTPPNPLPWDAHKNDPNYYGDLDDEEDNDSSDDSSYSNATRSTGSESSRSGAAGAAPELADGAVTQLPPCPELQSLCIVTWDDSDPGALLVPQRHALSTLTALTTLQLTTFITNTLPASLRTYPADIAAWVTRLDMPHLTVRDTGDIECLLGMPRLRHVCVAGFEVEGGGGEGGVDYSGHVCAWRHLTVSTVHVDSMVRLPLKCLESYAIGPGACIESGRTPHSTPRLLTSLPPLRQSNLHELSLLHVQDGREGEAMLCNNFAHTDTAATPLLALLVKTNQFEGLRLLIQMVAPVTIPFLQALNTAPVYTDAYISCLWFRTCQYDKAALEALLTIVPETVEVIEFTTITRNGQVDEEALTQMCVRAVRPVTVCVDARCAPVGEGWRERVAAAQRAAGNTYVTLRG